MKHYNEEQIQTLIDELYAADTNVARSLAREIKESHIADEYTPYSDGDEMLDEHQDLIDRAEEYLDRLNG